MDDENVNLLKTIDLDKLNNNYEKKQDSISTSLGKVYNEAQKLYEEKALDDEVLEKKGLYTIQNAYDLLRNNNLEISFRAFCGRVERGTVASIKAGKKRYIPLDMLNTILNIRDEYYSVKNAYETYKKANPKINYRAFIGRVEKKSVPSVKLGTKRLIPRGAIDALTHVAKNYHTVSSAIQKIHKAGIGIKRNAFERRLDRDRIPHVKIVGRRFIPLDVVDELIEKELELRGKK